MRKTSVHAAMATAAVAVFGVITASPASAGGGPNTHRIVNVASDKCLEIPMGHDYDGAPAQQWDCNGGANQTWIVDATQTADGRLAWTYRNAESGKCLEVADWRKDAGAPVRVWQCTGGANQQWVEAVGQVGVSVRNVNSGMALDMPGFTTANDTDAVQWWSKSRNEAAGNQEWYTGR
ncbi:RICIN domain-containing protein [Streptomyces sp. NPDC023838]|uniref:RICIN domain-containing protein n=1 Tax=Streptomyces sp. NPDC023838 TaxID=3154325 RepID=UPI0033C4E06A